MTDEFLQWLREQLDDDERMAASGESWTAFDESQQGTRRVDVDHSFERVVACTRSWRGLHIARHDPARVLAEVTAKRELLDQYEHLRHDVMPDDMTGVWAIEAALRALGAVYADCPGYRDEWRP